MTWKFWKMQPAQDAAPKLSGRKDIYSSVGRYLVVTMHKDPDWVWKLKEVSRPRQDRRGAFDVRVFDQSVTRERGVEVRNYLSLDAHPDLILFEGWYDKKGGIVELAERH